MPLNICEINLFLTWSANCLIIAGIANNQEATFAITKTKGYVQVVTLSTQDHAKLLQQLKTSFKRTINWIKSQSELTILTRNQYLSYLINPSF